MILTVQYFLKLQIRTGSLPLMLKHYVILIYFPILYRRKVFMREGNVSRTRQMSNTTSKAKISLCM